MASSSLWLPAPTRTAPPPPGRRAQQAQAQAQRPRPPSSAALTVAGGGATATAAAAGTRRSPPASSEPSVAAGEKKNAPPTYEGRCRAASEFSKLPPDRRKGRGLFVPRSARDFDDGGAFPEIHVAQYPRNMGNPHLGRKKGASSGAGAGGGGGGKGGGGGRALTATAGSASAVGSKSGQVLNVEIDASGEVSYDAVVTGGTNADRKVYARHSDLRGSEPTPEDVALPTAEEERRAAERTAAAIGAVVDSQAALDRPTGSAMVQAATARDREEKTQFVRYTPREDAPGYNPSAKQRVIQLVPAQIDPMQPPKHKHKKAPRGPAEDPVPVLHAPPEKLTKEERDKWNVPACISNWKNTRGYTIPLDKRLAADGRGLRDETTVNPNFATLSESLYVAERQAREEVRMRATVQKRLAETERERREAELRELASRARRERAEQVAGGAPPPPRAPEPEPAAVAAAPAADASGPGHRDDRGHDDRRSSADVVPPERPESEEAVAARQRERLRQERRREREKELRLERMKGSGKAAADDELEAKRRKLESERDVSERVALGTHVGTGTAGGDVDTRLYNQSAGMDSGFGADDEYNTYSEPMFGRQGVSGSSIYRPTRGEAAMDGDAQYDKLVKGATSKFQADKGFSGAEGGGAAGMSAGPRTAPVQFERGGTK